MVPGYSTGDAVASPERDAFTLKRPVWLLAKFTAWPSAMLAVVPSGKSTAYWTEVLAVGRSDRPNRSMSVASSSVSTLPRSISCAWALVKSALRRRKAMSLSWWAVQVLALDDESMTPMV